LPTESLSEESQFGRNIIFIGIAGIGVLITILGLVADKGATVTVLVGATITIPAFIFLKPINYMMNNKHFSLRKLKNKQD
jgi:SSS family solute:Na+ symporter